MLTFETITPQNAKELQPYYEHCTYRLCEYSVGVKVMWRGYLRPEYTIAAGCLIVRSRTHGHWEFDYPVPGPEGDVDEALRQIETWCTQNGCRLILTPVPEMTAERLVRRYPQICMRNDRAWKDYLYNREDLANFAGRRYSGQRNHINKFRKNYPDAQYVELTVDNSDLVEDFWNRYSEEFQKEDNESARHELAYAKELFTMLDTGWFRAGGLLVDGHLVALCLGELCGETMSVHIEKALYSHAGAYPAMVQAFAQNCGEDVRWMNREDDARDKGLRTSKLQYLPCELAGKMQLTVGCELDHVDTIPALTTERLTLDELTEADNEVYQNLCLDDERNRWWGYDYRKDLKGELTEHYFLDVTREDFAARRAINFAVRREGQCIGEVVLYDFDWRGGAELGCRIIPECAGYGYGTEAFAAVAEWALYRLGLTRVVAKCYKENEASYKMLSSCMRKTGEDDTFYHFEKMV